MVKTGEKYTISIGSHKRIIEVKGLTIKRGSFEIAKQYYTDHSPPVQKQDRLPSVFFKTNVTRDKGAGRPTKKDRRDLRDFGWE